MSHLLICLRCGKRCQKRNPGGKYCGFQCFFLARKAGTRAKRLENTPPPPVSGARWLPLGSKQFALVDKEDYDRLMSMGDWIYDAGTDRKHTDRRVQIKVRLIGEHSLVLGVAILQPEDSSVFVDHRDGNRLNCRKQNLRIVTPQQSIWNTAKHRRGRGCTSSYKGVCRHRVSPKTGKRRFVAHIYVNGKSWSLGVHDDEISAAHAYDAAAREAFGEFACVNFPRPGERPARSLPAAP